MRPRLLASLWDQIIDPIVDYNIKKFGDVFGMRKKKADVFGIRKKKADINCIPDDIMINILGRLPADFVLQCRIVCKWWRDLTSSTYFVKLQLQMATPTPALCGECLVGRRWLSLINIDQDSWEMEVKLICKDLPRWLSIKDSRTYLLCSCNGMLLFEPKHNYESIRRQKLCICNPLTNEAFAFAFKAPNHGDNVVFVCGFFFHPLSGEYRMLFYYDHGDCYRYKMLNLRTMSCRDLTSFSYIPPNHATSSVVNGSLYWIIRHFNAVMRRYPQGEIKGPDFGYTCANAILRFDITTEEFDIMPHPEYEHCSEEKRGIMYLLEMEGQLCLCHVFGGRIPYYTPGKINVWILADVTNRHWIRKYTSIECETNGSFLLSHWIDLVSIHKDEILLGANGKLYVYNLQQGFGKRITYATGEYILPWQSATRFISYTKTLVSPYNL